MFQALRRRVRMVAKSELFKIPGWGPAMRLAGFVEIDRKDRVAAIESLDSAKQAARTWHEHLDRAGRHARARRQVAAVQAGRVSPGARRGRSHSAVSIDGTAAYWPPRPDRARGVEVRVTVHEPVPPAQYGPERREELAQRVRQAIASDVSSLRDKS